MPAPPSPAAPASHAAGPPLLVNLSRTLERLEAPVSTRTHSPRTTALRTAAAGSLSARAPSQLPPSAHIYTRAPLTSVVSALSPGGNGSGNGSGATQWETLIFPSADPLAGGETEVRRLAAWFDSSWAQLETEMHARAAQRQKQRSMRQQLLAIQPGMQAEEKNAAATAAPSSLLSASDLRRLAVDRSKLCHSVFRELIRHVSSGCRRRGALLERVWAQWSALQETLHAQRIDDVLCEADERNQQALAHLRQQLESQLNEEREARIKARVDLTHLEAQLEAKTRLITQLQEENDKDLLYSNQIVCAREMACLRMQREAGNNASENARLVEEMRSMNDAQRQLEDQIDRLESEKEQLALVANQVEQLDAHAMRGMDVATQYNVADAASEPTEEEKRRVRASMRIQKLFRGWRTRRKLKLQGLLSRKLIMRRLQSLRAANLAAAAGVAEDSHSTADLQRSGPVGLNLLMPRTPAAFAHLLSPIDVELNRDHFIRIMPRKPLLKLIHKLYLDKTAADERETAAGRPPTELADFIYDFFLQRQGARDAAEMELVRLKRAAKARLDLFASVEKLVDSSARVRLFSLFLNNALRHRALPQLNNGQTAGDEAAAATQAVTSATPLLEHSHAHLLEHYGADVAAQHRQYVDSATSRLVNLSSEADVSLRVQLALHGGRNLTSRATDFYLRLLSCVRKHGRGPLQFVSDDASGQLVVEIGSFLAIATRVCAKWPHYATQALLDKLQYKAGAVMVTDSTLDLPHGISSLAFALASPAASTSASSAPSSPRFVDCDVLLEVMVEAFLDEDMRQSQLLTHKFLQQAGAHGITTTASSSANGSASSLAVEPEVLGLSHFGDVVRSLAPSCSDARTLLLYKLAVSRAHHRAVSVADLVDTLRAFGLMPVPVDWHALDEATQANGSRDSHATADDGLPPLDDDEDEPLLTSSADSALERRHRELKEKMREMEAGFTQKLEASHRRHDKELTAMRQAHEREIALMQQTQQQQIDSLTRSLASERSKAASDFNSLFDSTAAEIAALKSQVESLQQSEKEYKQNMQSKVKSSVVELHATISSLQSRLASKSDKYAKKKEKISIMQQTIDQLQAQLRRAQLAPPSDHHAPPRHDPRNDSSSNAHTEANN